MTYATPQDVAEELGRSTASLSAEEILQFDRWIRRAEATIKVRVPDLDALVASGALAADVVAGVEAAAVARKVLNPEGKQSEGIDDYTYRRTNDAATIDVVITDAEWLLVQPRRRHRAFTVNPVLSP